LSTIQLNLFDNVPKKETGLTVYKASAGSGKTYTLTLNYLKQALSDGYNPNKFREILAVTFTNKATDEMKARIIDTLNNIITKTDNVIIELLCSHLEIDEQTLIDRAKRVQRAILHNYSDFSISTIDKFFQKILHVFVREAGLRPGFRLELDQERLMDEAVDKMMLNIHKNEALYKQMSDIIDEQMERGAAWDIRRTLKTRGKEVFNEQFRELGADFHRKIEDSAFMEGYLKTISAITNNFEEKMHMIAKSAIQLIEEFDAHKSDFYYGKTGPINHFYKLQNGDYDEPGTRIKNILNSDNDETWLSKKISEITKIELMQITGHLTMLLKQSVDLYNKNYAEYCTALSIKKSMNVLGFLAEIEANVKDIANTENLMPISETTHLLGNLIDDSDAPFIYERAGTRYSTFMIDEFQDTSAAQWKNFKPLLQNSLAENKDSLVVGDVKQSIYRWRNGDWRILASKIFSDFNNFAVFRKNLDTNWRSSPNIIEFNNELFSSLPKFIENEFLSDFPENDSQTLLSAAYEDSQQKTADKNRSKGGYVSIQAIRDTNECKAKDKILENLPSIIADIQDRGYKAKEILILVRKSADGQVITNCLLNHKHKSGDANHCFEVLSPDSLFISKSETIQFIISLMRAIVNPENEINNATINHYLNKDNDKYSWENSASLSSELKQFLSGITSLSLSEIFEQFVVHFNLENTSEIAYLQELHDEIITFANTEISDTSAFINYWDNKGDNIKLSAGELPDAINIMTIHKAKGLEYPIVIIPYCDWPMKPMFNSAIWVNPTQKPYSDLPHVPVNYNNTMKSSYFLNDYRYETMQSLIDNLNLLYVSFTRAKEELYIMLPLSAETKSNYFKKDKIQNAATTILNFIEANPAFLRKKLVKEAGEYILGEKQQNQSSFAAKSNAILLETYNTQPFDKKLRLKYESENFFPELATPIQLRNYGNLMHKVFSYIHSEKDIPEAIALIENEGLLSKEQLPELQKRINNALLAVKDWFADNSGYKVITEKFLLLPSSMNKGMSRRPDRIMISPNKTIIIDYKFGAHKNENYNTQVKSYIELLAAMNYPNIEGYIWYVDQNQIEKI